MKKPSQPLLPALLALVVWGGAYVAPAQSNPDSPDSLPPGNPVEAFRPERRQGGERGQATSPPAGEYQFIRVMNEEQRGKYRAAVEANREQKQKLMARLRNARREMNEVKVGEKFDEAAFRAKAEAAAKIQVEIDLLDARAFAQIRPSLTEEQVKQIKSSPLMPRRAEAPGERRQTDNNAAKAPPAVAEPAGK